MLYPRDVLYRVPLVMGIMQEPWQNGHAAACLYPARDSWHSTITFELLLK